MNRRIPIKSIILLLILLFLFSGCAKVDGNSAHIKPARSAERNGYGVLNETVSVAKPMNTQLSLTELMSGDADGCGWIEVHNFSNTECDPSDYVLTLEGREWYLPEDKIPAGAYAVFRAGVSGDCQIPFALPKSGEISLSFLRVPYEKRQYSNPSPFCSYDCILGKEIGFPTPGYAEKISDTVSLEITEVMTKNLTYVINGTLADWFEVKNVGNETVDLSLFFASDKKKEPFAFRLPQILLDPGAYCVIPCTGESELKLSEEGETLYLTRADGVLSSSVKIPALTPDCSYADGCECLYPTPGYANDPENHALVRRAPKSLLINEIVASNTKVKKAGDGKYYDVIELYNNSGTDIMLSDYCLSDKRSEPTLWRLPDVSLKAGGYYVVFATGSTSEKYASFAPFSVSSDGENLYLAQTDGTFVDAVASPKLPVNVSYGRSGDDFLYYPKPTINASNGSLGVASLPGEISVSVPSGIYSDSQTVWLDSPDDGTIYYTLDGSVPTPETGILYEGEPIEIGTTCAIRAINYTDGTIPSTVQTFNYFINEPDYTLGIIKISVDQSEFDLMYEEFLKAHEVPANVSYYLNGNEEFNVNCGLKLSGRSSLYFEKKSFLLHFRAQYGNAKLKYKLFDNVDLDEFNTLVLRSGSGGAEYMHFFFNDEFVSAVVNDSEYMDLIAQGYRPVDVYVNDTYYGIYFIREKINAAFVADHDDAPKDSVSVVESMSMLHTGTSWQGVRILWQYIADHDLTVKANYEHVASQIDLESVADYYILQAWSCNTDSTNMRVYKSTADDGKWRMLPYDLDTTFSRFTSDYGKGAVKSMLSGSNKGAVSGLGSFNMMIVKLLKNPDFRALFFSRLAYLVENDLATENVLPKFEKIYGEIAHDMEYNIPLWKNSKKASYHKTVKQWNDYCDKARTYWLCDKRLEVLVDEFISVVKLTDDEVRAYMGDKYVK